MVPALVPQVFHDVPLTPENHWASPPPLEALPENALVVWDIRYSDQWGLDFATLSNESGNWRQVADFENGTAVIFRKIARPGKTGQQ